MQSFQEITTSTSNITSNNKYNTTSNTSTSSDWVDAVYNQYSHLCGEARFRKWYIKRFYIMGKTKTLAVVQRAEKDGTSLGWLIKKELS